MSVIRLPTDTTQCLRQTETELKEIQTSLMPMCSEWRADEVLRLFSVSPKGLAEDLLATCYKHHPSEDWSINVTSRFEASESLRVCFNENNHFL